MGCETVSESFRYAQAFGPLIRSLHKARKNSSKGQDVTDLLRARYQSRDKAGSEEEYQRLRRKVEDDLIAAKALLRKSLT